MADHISHAQDRDKQFAICIRIYSSSEIVKSPVPTAFRTPTISLSREVTTIE
jgi:hypothetical protein